jgi:hypothetical protein
MHPVNRQHSVAGDAKSALGEKLNFELHVLDRASDRSEP